MRALAAASAVVLLVSCATSDDGSTGTAPSEAEDAPQAPTGESSADHGDGGNDDQDPRAPEGEMPREGQGRSDGQGPSGNGDAGSGDGGEPPADPDGDPGPAGLPEAPPVAEPYELSDVEVYPNAKRLAADLAQALTTYDPGTSMRELIEGADLVPEEALVEVLDVVHDEDRWSRGKVVYPQLGGVTSRAASVMVVTTQLLGTPDGERTRTRTLDVRLRTEDGVWVFDRLVSVGGAPVEAADDLPEVARTVLDDPRIELPHSARWDILEGGIAVELLEVMAALAERSEYGVVTLRQGHPRRVFDTDRLSDHTRGRAVDIHRFGDRDVIDDRVEGSLTYRSVEWLLSQSRIDQVGGPWDLDGRGARRSFSDVVHQDHLHVSVGPEEASDPEVPDTPDPGADDDDRQPDR